MKLQVPGGTLMMPPKGRRAGGPAAAWAGPGPGMGRAGQSEAPSLLPKTFAVSDSNALLPNSMLVDIFKDFTKHIRIHLVLLILHD